MEAHLQRGCNDVTAAHVKTEDENTPALEESEGGGEESRQDAPAGERGGAAGGALQPPPTSSSSLLLYPVSWECVLHPSGGSPDTLNIISTVSSVSSINTVSSVNTINTANTVNTINTVNTVSTVNTVNTVSSVSSVSSISSISSASPPAASAMPPISSTNLLPSTKLLLPSVPSAKPLPSVKPLPSAKPLLPTKPLPSGWDFSSAAVQSLIGCVGRRWALYEARERSRLFSSVQEAMAAEGHVIPVEKIRRKWNNLIVTYKRVKERGRQGGGAKTSWEFYQLMDATLCDTIGCQVVNSKRTRGISSPSLTAVKPAQLSPPPTVTLPTVTPHTVAPPTITLPTVTPPTVAPPTGAPPTMPPATRDFSTPTALSPSPPPEVKPLIVLNGDITSSGLHPAPVVTTPPPFISSLPRTASTDINNAAGYRRAPPSPTNSSGVTPHLLSPSPSLSSLSSSFISSPTSFCLMPSTAAAVSQSGEAALREALRQEEEQRQLVGVARRQEEEQRQLVGVARRRGEARERRRERREVKMAEALGRMASALELISSKQDTLIALLQRMADRK